MKEVFACEKLIYPTFYWFSLLDQTQHPTTIGNLDGILEVDFFIPSNQTFPEASESQQTL